MFRRFTVLLLLTFSQVVLISCNQVDDNSITTAIQAKMFSDPSLKSANVNVTSKDGIVTITGIVLDEASRSAAERIASQTKGVKQVIDSTTVAPPPQAAQAAPPPSPPDPAPAPPIPSKPAHKKERPAPETPAEDRTESASPAPAQQPAPADPAAVPAATPPPAPAPPPPPQPVTVTIPEGTVVTVRTIDPIDSATNTTGQFFQASLDNAVVIGDQVVLPKGLNAKLKLVQAASSGKFKGASELTVSLDSVTYQGKTYAFQTSDVQEKGASRGKRSAAVIGGGTALGALIGGLAGGGKGAAIGAGVGAGAGTGIQAMTKGQQVKIPSETRLDFTMHAPLDVTYIPGSAVKKSHTAPPPSNSDQAAQQ